MSSSGNNVRLNLPDMTDSTGRLVVTPFRIAKTPPRPPFAALRDASRSPKGEGENSEFWDVG
jgi:hypothetical protein